MESNMKRSGILIAGGIVASVMLASLANSQDDMRSGASPTEMGEFNVYPAGEIKWRKGPESLPAGLRWPCLKVIHPNQVPPPDRG